MTVPLVPLTAAFFAGRLVSYSLYVTAASVAECFVTFALAAIASAFYRALLRRPILTWGATEAEATSRLPGDELLEDADGVSTRAIEIAATAADVWPWLAQMGPLATRRGLHLRLDREPAPPQYA
jgi:hypothetical protein